jgi:hypothetical protein
VKHLPTSLFAALVLSSTTASAQTTFSLGVRGGLNWALATLADASNSAGTITQFSADKSAIFAWQAGLVLEARFGKLSLQPAVLFSQKGEKFTTSTTTPGMVWTTTTTTTSTNRYNWLELPVNLVYTSHGDHGWQLLAGPYVAVALGGKQRGTTTTYNPIGIAGGYRTTDFDKQVLYGSQYNNRRLDAGLNFGLGYRQGPWQVQATYSLGLLNLHHPSDAYAFIEYPQYFHDFEADAAYNRVAQLTGTYFFSL